MTRNARKTTEEHREAILAAGLVEARAGLAAVTMRGIARSVGVSHKQIARSFGTVEAMRQAIAAEAVARGDRQVIGRLVVDNHPAVAGLAASERVGYVTGLVA